MAVGTALESKKDKQWDEFFNVWKKELSGAFEEAQPELKEGDLVRLYDGQDAEGHRYYRRLGVVLGTTNKPASFMQFFTYRVFVGDSITNVHEVWIKKIETEKESK